MIRDTTEEDYLNQLKGFTIDHFEAFQEYYGGTDLIVIVLQGGTRLTFKSAYCGPSGETELETEIERKAE